ncbi:hypothetical protein SAMN04488122_1187 [Chitinophaga arvensicola]|uniref:Uncharacterized protein n=1 Tax=Chitinophaga arvensicola TaxID=29529 RepID=A0A1I0Q352_9BACT|nr:hypothetical protein SAMN04488122_1187 [Chitinophaga arvensicola]
MFVNDTEACSQSYNVRQGTKKNSGQAPDLSAANKKNYGLLYQCSVQTSKFCFCQLGIITRLY